MSPVQEFPKILCEVFKTGVVFDPDGSPVTLGSNISEQEARHLFRLVCDLRPSLSVEVGFAQGISTMAILGGLRANGNGHHHVMDPFQARFANCGIAMVKRAGLDALYTFHEKFAEEVIPGLPRIQFAFIDASHLFDLTLSEFVMVDRKLDVGGVVGFHDMWMASQQSLIRYILSNRSYEVFRPASALGEAEPPSRSWWKKSLQFACSKLPGAERVFTSEFLSPWQETGLGNMVFLRKTAEDSRDWKFHAKF